MKKDDLTPNEVTKFKKVTQSLLFMKYDDAKYMLQKYFPDNKISIMDDPRGITEIRVGNQVCWIPNGQELK